MSNPDFTQLYSPQGTPRDNNSEFPDLLFFFALFASVAVSCLAEC
jgi:hypothetical protein